MDATIYIHIHIYHIHMYIWTVILNRSGMVAACECSEAEK